MTTISFMSANFVARATGYRMTDGWAQGEAATNAYFQPVATFGQRFDELLGTIRALGFVTMDIWTGHLNWAWATDAHLATARDLLRQHRLTVTSYAGGYGTTVDEFAAACRVAQALDAPILGGTTALWRQDRPATLATLEQYDRVLAIENHPGLDQPGSRLRCVCERRVSLCRSPPGPRLADTVSVRCGHVSVDDGRVIRVPLDYTPISLC